MAAVERVVLVNDRGSAIGTALKSKIHGRRTPLHLAFSCYLVEPAGDVLLTRRAGGKLTWPGVWTNSCCGHPLPGEHIMMAVRRRLRDELGLAVGTVDLILPRFRYRAVMENGVAENELCPVFRASSPRSMAVRLNPDEVDEARWISWAGLVALAGDAAAPVSPWCRAQVTELGQFGESPSHWPAADLAHLPSAAVRTGGPLSMKPRLSSG